MWPSARCISSYIVRTPSPQLGVLQSLRGSFQLFQSHPLTSLVHTSGGIQSEATTSPSPTKAAQVRHKGVNPFTEIHQQSAKLGPKQLGPFEITEVISDLDYRLALPLALKIHDVFHVDRLSPYKGNDVNGLTLPPPDPVTVDSKEEYEVNHIRDSKLFGRTLKYLVRWTGYGEGEDTWEPVSNLKHSPEKIQEFHTQHPGAPQKINALLYASLPWQSLFTHTEANADVDP